MENDNSYKSYNCNKSIEELEYRMIQYKNRLEEYIVDYRLFKFLLEASIYKPNIINLFETLQNFKSHIIVLEKAILNLLNEVNVHIEHLKTNMESRALENDTFNITNHDLLEQKVHTIFTKITNNKHQIMEYLCSVMLTKNTNDNKL